MKAFVIYHKYYDIDTEAPSIGGVQTYITELICLLNELNYDVVVIQNSTREFEINLDHRNKIIGTRANSKFVSGIRTKLNAKLLNISTNKNDLVIYASDHFSKKIDRKTIVIQHGVDWDLPQKYMTRISRLSKLFAFFIKLKKKRSAFRGVKNGNHLVCVDYNFLNCLRCESTDLVNDVTVIPNFYSKELSINRREHDGVLKVIFARRMEKYRGTDIFSDTIDMFLASGRIAEFTFAGAGPELEYLKEKFKCNAHVRFLNYSPSESMKIHSQHDVAIVPSMGSEGTSLSAIEAMAAGCGVIASNVGGLTNIIIHGYNGLLINPCANELCDALFTISDHPEILKRISKNGKHISSDIFTKEKWREKWKNVINKVCHL